MAPGHAKRKRTDADDGDQGKGKQRKQFSKPPPRRKENTESKNPYTQRGHRKGTNPKAEDEEAQKSINALKSRVRDLTRSLRHAANADNNRMPQGVRIERERELESCKHELEEREIAQRESKFKNGMISKYHMVRFFERQKATRILKRLHKQLAAREDESEKAEKLRSIHNAEVDLNYTLYYPLLKAYVSLYPHQKKVDGKVPDAPSSVDGPKGDIGMWKVVEKAMEDQTLEALRESREGVKFPGAPPQKSATNTTNSSTAAPTNEEEEDSDDGFFA